MTPVWMAAAGLAGVLSGPVLRGQVFHHAVQTGHPWRDRCPYCSRPITPPGWQALLMVLPPTGQCPQCRNRIGPPAGIMEAVAAAVLAAVAWRADAPLALLAFCWVALLGIVLGFVDVAVHRLPDRLTLPCFAGALVLLGLAAMSGSDLGRLGSAVACAAGVTGCYLVLVVVSPAGMGFGDCKTALSTGLTTGWYGWTAAATGVAAGFLFAGGYAAGLLILRRARPGDHLPHGPFLLLGALTALLLT